MDGWMDGWMDEWTIPAGVAGVVWSEPVASSQWKDSKLSQGYGGLGGLGSRV